MSDTSTPNTLICQEPDCGYVAKSPVGLTQHMSRTHGAQVKPGNNEAAMRRVYDATDALFPEGIPSARIIQVAELQKAMLKVLS